MRGASSSVPRAGGGGRRHGSPDASLGLRRGGRAGHVVEARRSARVERRGRGPRSGRAGSGRAGGARRTGRQGLLAEAAAGLVLGAALAVVLLAAALFLVALAGLGGFALLRLADVAVGAALRLVLLAAAVLLLATPGIGQGAGAGVPLLIGKGAQDDARSAARSTGAAAGRARPWRGAGRRSRGTARARRRPPAEPASRPVPASPRGASPSRPRPPSSGRARSSAAPCLARQSASGTASWATCGASCRPGSSYQSFRSDPAGSIPMGSPTSSRGGLTGSASIPR